MALAALCLLIGSPARADSRRRVVVLDFDGEKAERFHDDVVKLLKKTQTVISSDKWNGTAEDLGATKITVKDVKKVAKKLKIDAVITGKVEKRRDAYIVRIKVREGKSGELAGSSIEVKADGPKLDGDALRDAKDELGTAIEAVEVNHGGDDDDGDDDGDKPHKKPTKKPAKGDDDGDDDGDKPHKKPTKKPAKGDDDDDRPRGKGFGHKGDDGDDDGDRPHKKPTKKPAKGDDDDDKPVSRGHGKGKSRGDDDGDGGKVADVGDGGGGDDQPHDGGESGEAGEDVPTGNALSPSRRAVDATLGLSFNARRLSFATTAALANKPAGYSGPPVAGAIFEADFYPGAMNHARKGIASNLGLTVLVDKVIKMSSNVTYIDAGMQKSSALATDVAHYAIGVTFRYPLGEGDLAPVLGARLRYGKQSFTIDRSTVPAGTVDLPNVSYTMIDPELTFRYPVNPKVTLNANAGLILFSNTGEIQQPTQYGAATVTGFELELGGDYLVTPKIFVRAAFKLETIGFTFKGQGDLTTMRDNDPTTVDVSGARDTYIGGAITAGYLY